MSHKHIRFLTDASVIAALYAVLTLALWQFSSLAVQVRLSEALCILPAFTPAAVPGLAVGCLLANLLAGNLWDALFGTLATLLAALCTRGLAQISASPWLLPLPAVFWNALIIPPVLFYAYGMQDMLGLTEPLAVMGLSALSVCCGQLIACCGIGLPLYYAVRRLNRNARLFP